VHERRHIFCASYFDRRRAQDSTVVAHGVTDPETQGPCAACQLLVCDLGPLEVKHRCFQATTPRQDLCKCRRPDPPLTFRRLVLSVGSRQHPRWRACDQNLSPRRRARLPRRVDYRRVKPARDCSPSLVPRTFGQLGTRPPRRAQRPPQLFRAAAFVPLLAGAHTPPELSHPQPRHDLCNQSIWVLDQYLCATCHWAAVPH